MASSALRRRLPSFFKVFLPNLSSAHLKIPAAFLKHLNGERSGRVSLEGPSGLVWSVALAKGAGEARFEDGWKEFVADHAMAAGDFLVFSYEGESRFTVVVYAPTGCEKEAALAARPFPATPVIKEELMARPSSTSSEEKSLKRTRNEVDSPVVERPVRHRRRKKLGADGHSNFRTMNRFKSRNECKDVVVYVPRKPSEQSEWIVKEESHELEELPAESSQQIGTSKRGKARSNYLTLVKSSELTQYGDVKVMRMGGLLSHRRPVTKEELAMVIERARAFKSNRPFFTVVMQEAYVYTSFFMSIPHTFVKDYLPEQNTEIALFDSDGKKWLINYRSYGKRGGFSGGWGRFSHAHNLEQGDVCVFELLKKYDLQVHIFRVVEELFPLVRIRKSNLQKF